MTAALTITGAAGVIRSPSAFPEQDISIRIPITTVKKLERLWSNMEDLEPEISNRQKDIMVFLPFPS
jgi:hypothetical protein